VSLPFPSALRRERRFQPPQAPAVPLPKPDVEPEPEPATEYESVPGAIGYVVVIRGSLSSTPQHLTNADLMDRASAEREAAVCRGRENRDPVAAKGRFVVCAVIPVDEVAR
jgi:hypothetical protein